MVSRRPSREQELVYLFFRLGRFWTVEQGVDVEQAILLHSQTALALYSVKVICLQKAYNNQFGLNGIFTKQF